MELKMRSYIILYLFVVFIFSGYSQEYYYQISSNGKYGLMDETGKIIVKPEYDGAEYNQNTGNIQLRKGKYWAVYSLNLVPLTDFIFEYIASTSEGYTMVKTEKGWNYLDANGTLLSSKYYYSLDGFHNGLAIIKELVPAEQAYKYFIIRKDGSYLIETSFDFIGNFSEGICWFEKNNSWGFIDTTGKEIFSTKVNPENFYAPADMVTNCKEGLAGININGKWGFINTSGKIVIDPQFEKVREFSEGKASVQINGMWGFIDKTGKVIIEPKYAEVYPFKDGISVVMVTQEEYNMETGEYKPANFALINTSGKYIFGPGAYYFNTDYKDNRIVFNSSGDKELFGILDYAGRIFLKPSYELINSFSSDMAKAKKNGKCGFLDINGNEAIPFIYDEAYDFRGEIAKVVTGYGTNKKTQFINKSGKVIREQN